MRAVARVASAAKACSLSLWVAFVGSVVPSCGARTELDTALAVCEDDREPTVEQCNGVDDDCDGVVDDGFRLGTACDGPDSDLCADDVMTCDGCSAGEDLLETCNGVDDDCDGIVDADCERGDCRPMLIVTGSTPSDPSCVDFPVEAQTSGAIQYPCGGGAVTADLGGVGFSGSVANGFVSLEGTVIWGVDQTPDGCVWRTHHEIQGSVGSGRLSYAYSESLLEGTGCWAPCTETGIIEVRWVTRP